MLGNSGIAESELSGEFVPLLTHEVTTGASLGTTAFRARSIIVDRMAALSITVTRLRSVTITRSVIAEVAASITKGRVILLDVLASMSVTATSSKLATFLRSATALLALGSSKVIAINMTKLSSLTSTPIISRAISVARSASLTAGATAIKVAGYIKSVIAGLSANASCVRAIYKVIAINMILSPVISRTISLSRRASVALAGLITLGKIYIRTCVVSITQTAVRVRRIDRVISTLVVASASIARNYAKLIIAQVQVLGASMYHRHMIINAIATMGVNALAFLSRNGVLFVATGGKHIFYLVAKASNFMARGATSLFALVARRK